MSCNGVPDSRVRTICSHRRTEILASSNPSLRHSASFGSEYPMTCRNTYSDQSRVRFLSPLKVFGYQDNSLCRLNENRRPTGEIAAKPDLNGSSNVKGYELFGGTRIENESSVPLLNCDLGGGQLHRRRRIEQFWSLPIVGCGIPHRFRSFGFEQPFAFVPRGLAFGGSSLAPEPFVPHIRALLIPFPRLGLPNPPFGQGPRAVRCERTLDVAQTLVAEAQVAQDHQAGRGHFKRSEEWQRRSSMATGVRDMIHHQFGVA